MRAARVPIETPPDPFTDADASYAGVKQYLASPETRQMSESDLERELQTRGQELLRQMLQAHLAARGPGEAVAPVHDAQGAARPERRRHARQLETVFGTVAVDRVGYGRAGAASLHPLDGQLNLPPERYSLEVRRRVAQEAAKSSFDEAKRTLTSYTGAEVRSARWSSWCGARRRTSRRSTKRAGGSPRRLRRPARCWSSRWTARAW